MIVNYAATEHTWLWQCGDNDGRCPGAFQVGCEPDDDYPATTTTTATTTKGQDFVGICNQMKNPLGTCDCPGNTNQLWISADCTEVNIYCSAKITFYYKTFTSLCFQKKAALEV